MRASCRGLIVENRRKKRPDSDSTSGNLRKNVFLKTRESLRLITGGGYKYVPHKPVTPLPCSPDDIRDISVPDTRTAKKED
ncbi:hypothetical protein [Methanogenium organophilum]|uniref:Uncharacterized protein n=1 Tax=Methanogenium organophilum TaxID=2199 RepID=A0A9X9S4M9_METOG|nr:hypothetical protein [Methanogenium organophilum]WAI01698.1 hypothetical protein OU421_02165 [Methanogenium organophilum]